ncbi:MAG TPA: penicillin-binding transpeptidase domain-containing protein [Acidimicrobiia bacterium]
MNRAIRRVGYACVLLVVALIGQLTYLQVFAADRLADDPRNVRKAIRDFSRPRGDIITADGQVVARSVPDDADGDDFDFQREYPQGDLFAQIVGYQSFVYGNTGVENEYNDELVGRDLELDLRNLPDILSGKENTGNVVLTVDSAAQALARDLLAGERGSIVALDPRTGDILAMYSNPSYDPNPLAGHDTIAVQAYGDLLQADPNKPDLPRAYRERYPPGSTFKTVTASVALETGLVTPTEPVFPSISELDLPLTNATLSNFGGRSCGGNLIQSFRQSCNTTFGQIGLDLGESFIPGMEAFGVYSAPPLDLSPGAASSGGPPPGSFQQNQPLFAFAGIGQGDVFVTPLELALVGAGIANSGVIMKPHVMAEITDADGGAVRSFDDGSWRTATSPATAQTVTGMMIEVVENGTGTAGQIPGVTVAGKTGTAQIAEGIAPHAWFLAFAPAEDPQVVVAVLVENGGNAGNDATGGEVSAPRARQMIELLLGR